MLDPKERANRAKENFRKGYSCCQSVVLAFDDITGLRTEDAERIASGLGGGVGRLREVCGSVSGMAMVAGYLTTPPSESISANKTETYAIVQELAERFRQQNGSIVCREIMGIRLQQKQNQGAIPAERTDEYYKTRPCEAMIGSAAEMLAEKINEINSKH